MAEVIGIIAFCLGVIALLITLIPSLWNFFICFIPARKESVNASTEVPFNYAVVVCAHNEEEVIGQCVQSVMAQTYSNFECFVVADNCTDATVNIARSLGATIIERSCEGPSSKGEALSFGIERIYELQRFDALCILDSDTTLVPEFLTELDIQMQKGFDAVTGRYLASNANESIISALYTTYWAMTCDMYNLSHANIGLNALAQGTGFAFRISALTAGWHTESLAEDAEMSLQLGLAGKTIGYAVNARCYAEQVSTLKAAGSQLRRWRAGCISLLFSYSKQVLAAIVRKPVIKSVDLLSLLLEYISTEQLALSLLFLIMAGTLKVNSWLCFTLILILLVTAFAVGFMSAKRNGQIKKYLVSATILYPLFLAFFGLVGISTFFVPVKKWNKVKHGS